MGFFYGFSTATPTTTTTTVRSRKHTHLNTPACLILAKHECLFACKRAQGIHYLFVYSVTDSCSRGSA